MANKNELQKQYLELTGSQADPDWTGKVLVDKIREAKKGGTGNKEKEIAQPENQLEGKIDKMADAIGSLVQGVSTLIDLQTAEKKVQEAPEVIKDDKKEYNTEEDETVKSDSYVPPKFREIVDTMLSPDFGIDVQDFDDRTDFLFTVIVPEEYSSLDAKSKELKVKDLRSKMIPRAKGENGVREWVELIRKNLNKYFTQEGVASPFKTPTI